MYIGWRVKHIRIKKCILYTKYKKTISWWVNLFVYTEKTDVLKISISHKALYKCIVYT